jgi:predicted O-methyltransferase YrrM
MSKKRVFISWEGKAGRSLAEALKDTILSYFELEPWISSQDLNAGTAWFTEIEKAMLSCENAVVCLTPGSSRKPWVNFESGFLYARLKNVKLITFGETLTPPLSALQYVDGHNKNDLVKLLGEMITSNRSEAEEFVNFKYSAWENRIRSILLNNKISHEIEEREVSILASTNKLKDDNHITENPYFRKVVLNSLQEMSVQLQDAMRTKSFCMPYVQYPNYLISLLSEFKVTVKAVALVDREEFFWGEKIGDEIRKATLNDSTRVFVFMTQKQIREYIPKLIEHAKKYNVLAMSYDNLTREFPDYTYDFSIIGGTQNRVLVHYVDSTPLKLVRFCSDALEISQHEDALNHIIDKAIPLPSNSSVEVDDIIQEIFSPVSSSSLTTFKKKQVEMSAYIAIYDYDLYEEEHAYYQDMMKRMISICLEYHGKSSEKITALELGAGTGIFTRRLVKIPQIEITALEIDWACFNLLKRNMAQAKSPGKCLNEDSRTFDPEGKFKYVFSSFADHHIRPLDKPRYFENIKKNLQPNGLVIVGDEFLPPYDKDDAEARRTALKTYHHHIIEIAKQNNQAELVKLEEEALISGLREIGDFKLSCSEYEDLVKQAGFKIVSKEKIGPLDRDDVGGVYVYTFTLS